jgi:hypothetical protein
MGHHRPNKLTICVVSVFHPGLGAIGERLRKLLNFVAFNIVHDRNQSRLSVVAGCLNLLVILDDHAVNLVVFRGSKDLVGCKVLEGCHDDLRKLKG